MFDNKNKKKIAYLDEERQKIWDRIVILEKQINERPSDIEKEARQASKKTAEFRNKSEKRLYEANDILLQIKKIKESISNISDDVNSVKQEINSYLDSAIESSDSIFDRSNDLLIAVNKMTKIFEEHPQLENEVSELDDIISQIEENSNKANIIYKGILTKKSEIDDLYWEIIGYEEENEEGEKVLVEGLKSELESSYNSLNSDLKNLSKDLKVLQDRTQNRFNNFIIQNEEEVEKLKLDSKLEYDNIVKKIENLLPTAMTAGLSSAFITKKQEEEKIYEEYKTKFNRGILYLSLVSLLPIMISIFFLGSGVPLLEVISRSPKVILSFLPLYIPLIWTTISANKKVNLSKRLIEEYSHKQVLSMTIEGLSKQIQNIEDPEISEELRIQLIRNFLLVSSENPGKLISNYQKSDNPLINILDRDKKRKQEESESKSIIETAEEKANNLIEKAVNEIEEGVKNVVKNTLKE